MAPKVKRCARCKREKPVSKFGENLRARDKLKSYCRLCERKALQAWKALRALGI